MYHNTCFFFSFSYMTGLVLLQFLVNACANAPS
uniref:Uncharacterized protein n=1 Tax=Setaria italica TaxID=4555 RepID=K3YF65_SETIT